MTEEELVKQWGYNKTKNLPIILDIYNSLGELHFEGDALILNKDQYKILQEKEQMLSKGLEAYTNKKVKRIISEEEYKQYKEQGWTHIPSKIELKFRQREEEERQKLNRDIEIMLEKIKECETIRDKDWIEEFIGTYHSYNPVFAYYWSLIGDNYIQETGGNIRIEEDIYNKIIMDKTFETVSGLAFINRRYKVGSGYNSSKEIVGTYTNKNKPLYRGKGVYGIYKDNELVYIGYTLRSFEQRWNEHKEAFVKGNSSQHLYRTIEPGNIEYKVLVDIDKLITNRPITRNEVEAMELALISLYKPIGNLSGNNIQYYFSEEEEL